MTPDPLLHQLYATRQHTDLIRSGERERLAAQVRPWYSPLTVALAPARAFLGSALIRCGLTIQGARPLPVTAHRTV